MSRYIDAEWLKQNFNTVFWSQVAKTIDSAPSIDIVRCGECKYFWKYSNLPTKCVFHLSLVNADDFCSYGSRSEKPNNCEECKHWNDTEDGCADRHECRATTEDWQDWKDRMWAEAIVTEPKTQTKTQNSNLTFEKADERCKGCGHYKLTCDLFSEICKYEPRDEPQK